MIRKPLAQFVLVILGILAVGSKQVLIAQSSQFSLEEAVAYAIEHSRDLKIEKLNIADAEGQLLEYKSIGIPKLELNASYNYYIDLPTQIFPDLFSPAVYSVLYQEGLLEEGPIPMGEPAEVQFGTDHNITAGVEFNTMLFDFAWLQGLKAQRLYRDLVSKNVDQKAYEVRASVTKAYLATLIAQRNFELLDNNVRNISEILRETKAIYEAGFAEKLDVDRLELSLQNLEAERQNVGRTIAVTKNLLKFQMGYPINREIVLTENFDRITGDLVVEDLGEVPVEYGARPEYNALLLAEELNGINIKVIKAGYLPTLRGFASYNRGLQRNDLFDANESPWFPTTLVGVSLNLPIFDGLEKKARIDRASVSLEKVRLQKAMFEESMSLEVRNATTNLENTRTTVQVRKRALELALEIYETAQIKYREGVGSSVELSQTEADYLTAQNNYINALYEVLVAKTELDIATGKI